MADLLDRENVSAYLSGRGLPREGMPEALAGGVSNIVLAVGDLVVKQALPRLRVADEWSAPTSRVLTEADAIDLAGRLTPRRCPFVIDRDPDRHAVVLRRAPKDWQDWKTRLLAGDVDVQIADELGTTLARWHTATAGNAGSQMSSQFTDSSSFEQLRVDPYYRTLARRAPEIAEPLSTLIDEMSNTRACFVHGDFSPKNVLVDPHGVASGLWVIDFEVAHVGDPAFDVAFMLTHLTLKAIHRPESASAYDRAIGAFATAYCDSVGPAVPITWSRVMRHVGFLILARVRGKSPAEYLRETERNHAWDVGMTIVGTQPDTTDELIRIRDEAAR